jgi:hypothetical protein
VVIRDSAVSKESSISERKPLITNSNESLIESSIDEQHVKMTPVPTMAHMSGTDYNRSIPTEYVPSSDYVQNQRALVT